MSTSRYSESGSGRGRALKRSPYAGIAARYALAAVGCGVFSAVYEHFSHGVYSPFMVGLFAWPLVLGALPAVIFWTLGLRAPRPLVRQLWGCSVLTLSLGSCVAGIMQIYGSASPYTPVYWVVGLALSMATAACAFASARHPRPVG